DHRRGPFEGRGSAAELAQARSRGTRSDPGIGPDRGAGRERVSRVAMSERRAPRLILEVAFLAALSAALTFAKLERYEIVGVMLLGWMLVVVFEWGALRA